jgi:hypothetical protein
MRPHDAGGRSRAPSTRLRPSSKYRERSPEQSIKSEIASRYQHSPQVGGRSSEDGVEPLVEVSLPPSDRARVEGLQSVSVGSLLDDVLDSHVRSSQAHRPPALVLLEPTGRADERLPVPDFIPPRRFPD